MHFIQLAVGSPSQTTFSTAVMYIQLPPWFWHPSCPLSFVMPMSFVVIVTVGEEVFVLLLLGTVSLLLKDVAAL